MNRRCDTKTRQLQHTTLSPSLYVNSSLSLSHIFAVIFSHSLKWHLTMVLSCRWKLINCICLMSIIAWQLCMWHRIALHRTSRGAEFLRWCSACNRCIYILPHLTSFLGEKNEKLWKKSFKLYKCEKWCTIITKMHACMHIQVLHLT